MHILFLSDSPTLHTGYGGQVLRVGRRLVQAGHKVSCFGGGVRGPLQVFSIDGMQVFTHPGMGDVPTIRHLLQRLKAENAIPDVLLVGTDIRFVEYLLLMESEIRKKMPVVLWHLWDNTPYPWFNESFYRMCTRVLCASKFTYDLVSPVLGGKAKYVSLGVDTDEFRPVYDHKERELLHGAIIPDSVRMTIGWVHRNIMRKRLSDMMIAFQKFTERKAGREKEVAFLLHTDPSDPEGSDVRELKSRLVGRDRCFFLSPSMGQDPRYLNLLFDKMDVHVDISWNEGFGCTVAESMSAGVPNIVVASAELPHLVGDTGWVLPPTVSHSVANRTYPPLNTQILIDFDILGVDPLVDTLERLFENMGDVRSRREAARQRILDHFSIEDTAKKMEKELEEAVGSVEPLPDYKCVVV